MENEPKSRTPEHRTFSPAFHHGFVANSSGIDQYGPFRTTYFINSLGMRDGQIRKVALVSPPGGRILLLGDSYMEGVGVDYAETTAGQLAQRLQPKGIEVLNGGVASYCPSLIEARLRSWVKKDGLRFNLACVFIDISDLDNELRYGRDGSGHFLPGNSRAFEKAIEETENREFWFRKWLREGVEPRFVLWGALARNLRIAYERMGSPGSATPYLFSDWPAYRGPLEPWLEKSLKIQLEAMDRVLDLCRTHQADLVLVVYPWFEQIQRQNQEDRHTRFWQDWAESRKVPYLSLYSEFLPLGARASQFTLDSRDGHWNRQGHELVATRLEAFLDQNKLLEFQR